MLKNSFAALSAVALLGLAACADETVEEGDTTIIEDDTMTPEPMPAPEMDDGDSVTISEDGVQADISDGNTSVNADLDGDPSMEVEVN